MKLIILITLLPLFCFSQKKNEILMYTCQFISGSADGVNQAIVHHKLGQGKSFWDYKTSWQNKYKNFPTDKRSAFPLSKSVLVGFTDGYHMTRLIDRSFTLGSLAFALGEKQTWKGIIKKVLLSAISNRIGFYLFYNVIFTYKRNI